MSLSVPSVSASLLDRNAPPTPFSDLLDLSDNPETPETTYSFQGLKQHRNMQAEQNYLVEPILDRPPHFNTDDEMVDSDIERKDTDFDIDIDAYSNAGGVDLDDINIAMEDDYVDTAPETYDNDDLMIDEEEEILFQEQQQQSSIPPVGTLASLDSSDLPEPSQDTIRPHSAHTSTDAPLFSFSHHDSTPAHNISFAVQEQSSVPDHSLYEDVPTGNVEIAEEATSVEVQPSKPDAGNSSNLDKDDETQRSQSPAKVTEEPHADSDNLLEDLPANDSVELDNDFHHHGNWSENTSTTLAHEPTLLEDQQAFGDEEDASANHADEVETEIGTPTPIGEFTATDFAQYNLHPIVVQFGENRLSLFPPPPPIAEDGSVGSPLNDLEFLIQDNEICEKGIDQLFQELRSVLDGVVSKDVEFVMEIEGYEIAISEDNKSCNKFSLQDILSFHVQLHQHDGVETPEPLRINLTTRPTLTNRIASLTAAVNQGIGFTQAVGVVESSTEGNYMKTGGEQNKSDAQEQDAQEQDAQEQDVQEQDTQPDHEENQQMEYHNSDDEKLLEEVTEAELEVSQKAYPVPLVKEDDEKELGEVNEQIAERSAEVKKVEEIDDDDDFDLEYGNEEKEETEKDNDEAGDVELNADDTKSLSGSSSASETPKPTVRPIDDESKHTSVSVQIENTDEVFIEEISDELSLGAQQPEEIQDTPSDRVTSEQEDEELIEYEEDNETIQQPTTDDLEHQPIESKESPHAPSNQGSPQELFEDSSHYSPPDQTTPQESSHYSPPDQKISAASDSSYIDGMSSSLFSYFPVSSLSNRVAQQYNITYKYCDHVAYETGTTENQKAESPAHSISNKPENQVGQAEDWPETKEGSIHKSENVSNGPKVPSSIPVFQGDDGAEGEYEYVEDQQQEYEGYEYDNQALQFELEEREYDEDHGTAGVEHDHNNLQDPEYNHQDFAYTANYPINEHTDYLGGEDVLQGGIEGDEAYDGDGAYGGFEGEQQYPAEDENTYPIEYPHEGYNEDSVAYRHEQFGDVNVVETATDNEFGVPIKGDHEHPLSPSYAADILEKSSAVIKEVEEEQLIDYEDDEVELARGELGQKSPSQLQKSPGDQKRMREDELEQGGYESTGENQVAKRVRSQ